MGTLSGKTAIVTGGSRGIGRAIALKLGEMGAHVVATATSETGARETVEAISAAGGTATASQLNLGDQEQITQFMQSVHKEHCRYE